LSSFGILHRRSATMNEL
jgi:hypothetical protein